MKLKIYRFKAHYLGQSYDLAIKTEADVKTQDGRAVARKLFDCELTGDYAVTRFREIDKAGLAEARPIGDAVKSLKSCDWAWYFPEVIEPPALTHREYELVLDAIEEKFGATSNIHKMLKEKYDSHQG